MSDDIDAKPVRMKATASFVCPFCLPIRADVVVGYEEESDLPCAIHPIPLCEEFSTLELDAYVHKAAMRKLS